MCNLEDINIHSELSGDDYVEEMMKDDFDINPMVDDEGYLWQSKATTLVDYTKGLRTFSVVLLTTYCFTLFYDFYCDSFLYYP